MKSSSKHGFKTEELKQMEITANPVTNILNLITESCIKEYFGL